MTVEPAKSTPVDAPVPSPRPLDHILRLGSPSDLALVLKLQSYTYLELEHEVAEIAGWLSTIGKPGDRVASWAAKGLWTCLLPLAAARAGRVHVPINPLLKRGQVRHILADSGASAVIGTKARIASLEQADMPDGCTLFDEGAARQAVDQVSTPLGSSSAEVDDLVAILYTSGSTGHPKGVMLSHANLWLGAQSVAHYLELRPGERTLAVLPLSFDYGQNQLFSTWFAGGCVVPHDYLLPRDVAKTCARNGITTLAAVPPLWWQLVAADWPEEARSTIRRLTNSGGALTPALLERLQATFPGADVYAMYGLTEAFRSTFLDPALAKAHPTSIGRAFPFAEVLVVKPDGSEARAGEEGELVHCGPLVAKGYWNDPARTAVRFRPAPPSSRYGGIAVYSGDTAKREADGLLYFVGRDDEMIKSSGNRISPHEIEDAARLTGLVSDAVAIGVADEALGQAIHLVIVAAAPLVDEEAFLRSLAKELPNFMQPHVLHWRDAMPLNPNGKIDRAGLRASLIDEAR